VIAGLKSGLARLRLSDGAVEPIVAPEPDQPGNRINDGFVGPDGSLYFGTLDEGGSEPTASSTAGRQGADALPRRVHHRERARPRAMTARRSTR
jgi:sugar lactone lactonase YvrE